VKVGVNSAEGYYSVFKRGMKGVYQHCAERHLHRCVVEFDFCHSNRSGLGVEDMERPKGSRLALFESDCRIGEVRKSRKRKRDNK
jgi:hypothetical protein